MFNSAIRSVFGMYIFMYGYDYMKSCEMIGWVRIILRE